MNANAKAAELRTKLFNLVNEFKDLQLAAQAAGQYEIVDQVDPVACDLAKIHACLPGLFTDAYCDPKDQSFAVVLK